MKFYDSSMKLYCLFLSDLLKFMMKDARTNKGVENLFCDRDRQKMLFFNCLWSSNQHLFFVPCKQGWFMRNKVFGKK